MRASVKRALAAVVLFAAVLALTFPTDQVVRWVLTRIPLPEGRVITFQHARLRPWGLVFDDVAYGRRDGSTVLDAAWLQLRPSWSLLRGGFPLHVAAGVLGGVMDARIDPSGPRRIVDVSWTDLEVGRLLTILQAGDALRGRTTGRLGLKLPITDPARGDGEGELTLHAASWQPRLRALEDIAVHADTVTLRWALGDRRFQLSSFNLRGEELDLTAQGQVLLAQALGGSTLDVRVTIVPLAAAPRELLRLLDTLPRRSDGMRDFRLTGTLDAPRVSPP